MDALSAAWLQQLKTKDQVEQLLRAEKLNTADEAVLRIDTLKALASTGKTPGKWMKIYGIVLAAISVPLLFLLIGFVTLPIAIWLIWFGSRLVRRANEQEEALNAGLAAHLAIISKTG
jgi:hypothetical protein